MLDRANKDESKSKDENKDFGLMIFKVKMLHKALELYGQMALEIKQLAEMLNNQLNPYLLLPQHLRDENLRTVLSKITNFGKDTFIDYFKMKFEVPHKLIQT